MFEKVKELFENVPEVLPMKTAREDVVAYFFKKYPYFREHPAAASLFATTFALDVCKGILEELPGSEKYVSLCFLMASLQTQNSCREILQNAYAAEAEDE